MTYTFSREVINKYLLRGYGYFNNARIYTVFKDNSEVGKFLHLRKTCFFSFENFSARIHEVKKNWLSSKFIITEDRKQEVVGEYSLSGWVHQYGKVILDNEIYRCDKLDPDVRYSIFNKKTWGHYKIRVSNDSDMVAYRFQVKRPFFSAQTVYQPFTGEIDLYNGNLLLLFAGFFLLEQVFEKEDLQSTI